MFPEEAIRELVANALIHQDFNETGTSVTVEIYSDRLEVSNPGKPIIPPDRFADEYQSRNEMLAGLMRRLGMCEEQGLGLIESSPAPKFTDFPHPTFAWVRGIRWRSFTLKRSFKRWTAEKEFERVTGTAFCGM